MIERRESGGQDEEILWRCVCLERLSEVCD